MLAGVLLAQAQITRSIREGDESIHAVIAQQLAFQDGPSLIPRLRGLVYAQKPPLIHNTTALFLRAFGDHNWAYRIPALFLTLLSGVVLYRSGLTMFRGDRRVALLAVTLLLGSSVAFRSSHSLLSATPEPWLFFASTIGLISGFVALTQERVRWGTALLLPLSIAVGTMVKWSAGLFAFIPIGMFVIVRVINSVLRRTGLRPCGGHRYQSAMSQPWLTPLRFLLALLIGLLPIVSLIFVWLWHDPTFFLADVVDNTAQRLVVKGFHHQAEPLLYVQKFATGAYLSIPIFVIGFFGFIRTMMIREHPDRFSFLFLAAWWVIPLVLFSFLKSRNAWYYLPAIPGLVLFSAGGAVQLFDRFKSGFSRGIFVMSFGALCAYLIASNSELFGKRKLAEIDRLVSGVHRPAQTVSLYPPLEKLEKRTPSALTLRELLYVKRLVYALPQAPDADIIVRVSGKGDSVVAQYPARERRCIKERKFAAKGRYICFFRGKAAVCGAL